MLNYLRLYFFSLTIVSSFFVLSYILPTRSRHINKAAC
jgi:hypothetical protein